MNELKTDAPKKPKRHRKRRCALLILAAVLLLAAAATWLYLRDYYHAEPEAAEAIAHPAEGVTVQQLDGRIDFVPEEPVAGLIFYPGAKVEYTAYAPLMEACAERGVMCVLLEMPGNLAVLDRNAADGVAADYPQITRWYVGGHSLGGNIAATYASKHTDTLEGVVLLAAYATHDLTGTELRVLSVYGTEDGVMNRGRYDSYRENLPTGTVEVILTGGCHSYFGSYGMQKGDGSPTIPRAEQIARTADAIAAMVTPMALQSAA